MCNYSYDLDRSAVIKREILLIQRCLVEYSKRNISDQNYRTSQAWKLLYSQNYKMTNAKHLHEASFSLQRNSRRAVCSLSINYHDTLSWFLHKLLINASSVTSSPLTRSLSRRCMKLSANSFDEVYTRAVYNTRGYFHAFLAGLRSLLLMLFNFICLSCVARGSFSKTTVLRASFSTRIECSKLVACNADARYCSPRRIDGLRQRVSDPGIFSLLL